jgi:peptide/nickel transport system substrate-binding protein
MIGRRQLSLGAVALALATITNRGAGADNAKSVLRVVPQAEPQVFDPHQSGVNATQEHVALVYDTLFSWDANMVAQPQMVQTWSKSDDGLLYSFTLRPGLKFHDLSPVTSRDVVATLRRLLVRDTQNQILASLIAELQVTDDQKFTLRLKEPFHYVDFLLCGSNGVMGGIMREQDALTDPYKSIKSRIGSGPFRFVESEYRPGNKLVYEKFADYVPRAEPASGFAGGKRVLVDRVEWVILTPPWPTRRCARARLIFSMRRHSICCPLSQATRISSSVRSGRSRPTLCCASTRCGHPSTT